MERQGDEVHVDTDEARGAESTGVMRWVLAISIFLAIILLSGIWMFGAWTQDDQESQVSVSDPQAAMTNDSEGTDSIVSPDADTIDAVDAVEEPAGTIEN